MRSRSRLIIALALVLVGCSSGAPVGTLERPIIGGVADPNDPGVVLVIAQAPMNAGISLCTGEVVSPHVVMTAAHCVDPVVVGDNNTFYIFIGDDLNNPARRTTRRTSTSPSRPTTASRLIRTS